MKEQPPVSANRRFWQQDELALVASMYPECHAADVAAWLGRSMSSVYQAAAKLGLHKSAEFLASDTACRIRRGKQNPKMIAARFQPGHATWNKGTKGIMGQHPNSRRTQFKTGQMSGAAAARWVPVGSYRINGDGYLDRKVTDLGRGPRDWEAVHRLVWKEHVGLIPAGCIVTFRPGHRTTVLEQITPDRLECITRADLAHRNHPRNRDPELGRLIQLKGAITRQVNRIAREAQEQA